MSEKEFIMPPEVNKDNGTGGGLPKGYERYLVPDGLQPKDEINLIAGFLNRLSQKQRELEGKTEKYKKEADKYKEELGKQNSRNIEIIGVFSAILALIIVDVNIIKFAPNFLSSILLITALTSSIAIFAILIHSFFSGNAQENKINKSFWIPFSILIILVIIGVLTFYFKMDLFENSNPTNGSSQNKPIELEVTK